MRRHGLVIPTRELANWRPVEPGTYTHKQLPYGPMREGVTNGIVAYFALSKFSDSNLEIAEVHLDNLNVKLDKPPVYRASKAKAKKIAKETKTKVSKVKRLVDELFNFVAKQSNEH